MAYIGQGLGYGQRSVFRYVATAGQTTFSGADFYGMTLSYTAGGLLYLSVYVNGLMLSPPDVTATDGSTIRIASGLNAGDEVFIIAEATFNPANTYTVAQANALSRDGGCSLFFTSTTQLTLLPVDGGLLFVNGTPQQLPSAGVTLSNAGLASNTLHYIYAAYSVGTWSLVASTTGYTVDTFGRKNMTGDATKRLVGMVYTGIGAPGVFAANQTRSYFHDTGLILTAGAGSYGTSSTTNAQAVTSSVLMWAAESAFVAGNASVSVNVANNIGLFYLFVGSTQLGSETVTCASGAYQGASVEGVYGAPSDGLYTFSLQVAANANGVYTATFANVFLAGFTKGTGR